MASYHQYITTGILADKDFNINEVNHLEDIADMIFNREQYPAICLLIKEKNWDAVKSIDIPAGDFREYLSVYTFTDQSEKLYAATFYDSDELWQDPELIEFFSLD